MGSLDNSDSLVRTSTPAPLGSEFLPQSDSPDLVLAPASELERVQCWHLNARAWSGPLTIAQYLDREATLERQDLVADGKITFWILTLRDGGAAASKLSNAPNGSVESDAEHHHARPVFASCETLLKHAYIARAGNLAHVLAHGIGSVFVRPEYRKYGYASRMMTELGKHLGAGAWQQPKGLQPAAGYFSVLYSDIGIKFYARHGWAPMPSTHIQLPPLSASSTRSMPALSLPPVKELLAGDLPSICASATSHLEDTLVAESTLAPHIPHVAIRPDTAHMAWHHAREEVYARTLLGGRNPDIKGAIDPASGCALIWNRVFSTNPAQNQLLVLKVVVPPSKQGCAPAAVQKSLAALLLRAQLEAGAWDMHAGVEVWSPDSVEGLLRAAALLLKESESEVEKEVPVISRADEHVCSLRWEGRRVAEADEGQSVQWHANEKFAWC